MPERRAIVDYALQRRALLADVRRGRTSVYEVCDAHPYLQSAARFHGDSTDSDCPICRRERLSNVHYIYGDKLGHASGQAKSGAEIDRLAGALAEPRGLRVGEVSVYVVEVCQGCGWNHLVLSYVIGGETQVDQESTGQRAART